MQALTRRDWIALEKELSKRDLVEFLKLAWPILEPGQPYVHGWHMDAMAEHAEAVARGQITRLLVNVPPGTSKSTLFSVIFPAWIWGPFGRPEARIIGASHDQGLAIRDNRKTRLLIDSEWYQERWPVKLTSDQNEKSFMENERRGFRQATAVASMTGRRGDCLTGDTIISTDAGEIPIKKLVMNASPCNVLSYDEHTRRLVYRPIEAVARRAPKEIYRVHTSCGVVVECSGDHKFYTRRGYVEARFLSRDDVLLRAVRSGVQENGVSVAQSGSSREFRHVLQSGVFDDAYEPEQRKDGSVLQCVRRQNAEEERQAAVFGGVSCRGDEEKGGVEARGVSARAMRGLRHEHHAENAQLYPEVLLQSMQGDAALAEDERGRESGVARRRGPWALRTIGAGRDQQDAPDDPLQGWQCLRGLQLVGWSDDAPYRSQFQQQRPEKSCDSLPFLPREMACSREAETASTPVALVERLRRKEAVYDIQVAGTRCFFANGVLVHNCIIWDDPHSPEKAYSDVGRETAIRVFSETLPTRLNNPDRSAIIIVMQRLHEKDVSGHILANDLGYDHLCLPMEFEADRRCTTSIGWSDPREEEGDLLFPVRFPREVVERDKKVMGRYAVAGQFQQRPAPRSGGIVERSWWGLWDHRMALPAFEHIVMSLDTAFTESSKGDYSACSVWGLYRREKGVGVLLLDAWQERLGLPDLIDRVKSELKVRYGGEEQAPLLKPVWGSARLFDAGRGVDQLIIEDKGSGISLRQMLAREGISAFAYNPGKADKLARLHAISHIFANGMVFAPESSDEKRWGKTMTWAEPLIDQVCTFAGAGSLAHDDYVDSTTQALRYLADYARMSATEEMDEIEEGVDYTKKRLNPYG